MPTTTQQRTIAARSADWTDSVTLDQTDPALGITAITLALTGTLSSTVDLYSLERAASIFSSADSASVELERPDTTLLLSAAPATYVSQLLPAATSSTAPGFRLQASASAADSVSYTPGPASSADAALLIGTGTITFPVIATARISATGPGNFGAVFDSQVSATVSLTAVTNQSGADSAYSSVAAVATIGPATALFELGTITTPKQHVQIDPSITGWTQALKILGFDPALGALQYVNLTISTAANASLQAENLDPAAANLDVTQTATIDIDSNGAVLDAQAATIATHRTLAAFDGTIDAAGPSGEALFGQTAITTASTSLSNTAAFIGPAAAALTVSATGRTAIQGPGALAINAGLQAGASVDVSYTYVPAVGNLFDAPYYLAQNPDVAAAGVDPYQHYLNFGWKEGRNPSPTFDTGAYLQQYPDVAAAGFDPLLHYALFGSHEGRSIVTPADPLVDPAYYDPQLGTTLATTGTAAAQQAAQSYAATGWQKGLNPNAFFDTNYYLSHNPDVAAAHIDPLLQYETFGWKQGRDPSAVFSTDKYLAAYADVQRNGMDPLLHYLVFGQAEHRTAFTA